MANAIQDALRGLVTGTVLVSAATDAYVGMVKLFPFFLFYFFVFVFLVCYDKISFEKKKPNVQM